MNVEGYAESDEPAPRRQRRPALYPWVNVPAPLSTVAGAGCLTAVALALVQALLRVVLTYAPPGAGSSPGIVSVNPYASFAAKLALFSTDGAGLTVAVVLLVAVAVLAATSPGPDAHTPPRYARALAIGALVLAAVIVTANAAAPSKCSPIPRAPSRS